MDYSYPADIYGMPTMYKLDTVLGTGTSVLNQMPMIPALQIPQSNGENKVNKCVNK